MCCASLNMTNHNLQDHCILEKSHFQKSPHIMLKTSIFYGPFQDCFSLHITVGKKIVDQIDFLDENHFHMDNGQNCGV